ncbi:ComEC/Rec2 family competence protein [Candidatus Microgenomates bacterium]|nr:ComEC/Rec2 family competence protein [Candidatus Microgenomates bacterium]
MAVKVYAILLVLLLARLGSEFLSWQFVPVGAKVRLLATVGTEPIKNGKNISFRAENFWVLGPAAEIHFGDKVTVSGVVVSPANLLADKIELNQAHEVGWGELAHDRLVKVYRNVLTGRQADLLAGIVLGRVGLDRKFQTQLADVGLSHIVAASGMNLTLFSGFIVWLVSVVKWRRIYKAILSIAMIVLYTSLTGFEPSIVRAAVMISFVVLATILGRQSSVVMALLAAAYVMLWARPTLLTSASCLLSFSAMSRQIFLSKFEAQMPKRFNFLEANFWQSFLAILFTLPIVLWFFGKFSLVSLLSNLLVLWTIEPLMILGGLVGLSGLVSSHLAQFFALPAMPLLDYFLWVVNSLSGKDYFLFRWQVDSWTFPMGYYLALGGFIWWWSWGRKNDKIKP